MREIKFRAWNKDNKRIEFQLNDLTGWDDENVYVRARPDAPLSGLKNVVQFTGLKDKNGKEIYEGDIVVERLGNQHSGKPFEVAYLAERASFAGKWKVPAIGRIEPDNQFGLVFQEIGLIPLEYEVIGNIYENPELI